MIDGGSTSTENDPVNTDNKAVETDSDDIPLAKVKASLQPGDAGHNQEPGAKKGRAYFKTTRHGIKKPKKRIRKFPCTKCKFSGSGQGELNAHFLKDHGKLQCSKCPKQCAMISAYRKHMYEHSDRATKYPCEDCDKSFPFSSQLKNHRKLHLSALEHGCIHCEKRFKWNGELVKHLVTHGNKTWYCDKCTYNSKDPRNVRAHMHTHGNNTRYQCTKCNKGFNHYMQWKRHRAKNDCT